MENLLLLATDITKTLEKNIKYQIVGIVVFISYSLGYIFPGNNGAFVLFELEIPVAVIEIVCPILFLFWLSNFAINMVSLFKLSERIDEFTEDDLKSFNLFYPRSMFMSVLFSDRILNITNTGKRYKVKRYSNLIHIAILFVIPGINMALTTYSIFSSNRYTWIIALVIIYLVLLFELGFQIMKAQKSIRKNAMAFTLGISFILGSLVSFTVFPQYKHLKNRKENQIGKLTEAVNFVKKELSSNTCKCHEYVLIQCEAK